jgi:hypothetical protein
MYIFTHIKLNLLSYFSTKLVAEAAAKFVQLKLDIAPNLILWKPQQKPSLSPFWDIKHLNK